MKAHALPEFYLYLPVPFTGIHPHPHKRLARNAGPIGKSIRSVGVLKGHRDLFARVLRVWSNGTFTMRTTSNDAAVEWSIQRRTHPYTQRECTHTATYEDVRARTATFDACKPRFAHCLMPYENLRFVSCMKNHGRQALLKPAAISSGTCCRYYVDAVLHRTVTT